MVSDNESDWPPPGWKVQVRSNDGRRVKYYIHLETRQKFYSKPAVLRFIKDGSVSNDSSLTSKEDAKKSSGQQQLQLVETNHSPEWLPTGWTMEVRTYKSGPKAGGSYKVYSDPATGSKLYSKPEVFRYLKSSTSSNGKERASSKHFSRNRSVDQLKDQKSNLEPSVSQILKAHSHRSNSIGKKEVLVEQTVDEDLPSGWIKETRTKMLGNQVVRTDPFYLDPSSSLVFRSKLEVLRYLDTGEISRHAYRRKNTSMNGEEPNIDKASAICSVERKTTTRCRTGKQLFGGEETSEEKEPLVPEARAIKESGVRRSNRSSLRVRSASVGEAGSQQSTLLPEPANISPEMLPSKQLLKEQSATEETVSISDSKVKDTTPIEANMSPTTSRDIAIVENQAPYGKQGRSNEKAYTSKRTVEDKKLPNVPSRSSKRLAGVDALIENKLPDSSSRDIVIAENQVAVVVPGCSNENAHTSKRKRKDVKLPSVPSHASKRLARVDAQMETQFSASSPRDPVIVENQAAAAVPGCSNEKAHSKRKIKDMKLPSVPSRSSKRLAGVDTQVVFHTIPIEHTLRATSRKSRSPNTVRSSGSVGDVLPEKPRLGNAETQSLMACQEVNHRILDRDAQTVLATQGQHWKYSDSVMNNYADVADLLVEAPPGFSVNLTTEVPSSNLVQSSGYLGDTVSMGEIEINTDRPIQEPISDDLLGSKTGKSAADLSVTENQPGSGKIGKSIADLSATEYQPGSGKIGKSIADLLATEYQPGSGKIGKSTADLSATEYQPGSGKIGKSTADLSATEYQPGSGKIGKSTADLSATEYQPRSGKIGKSTADMSATEYQSGSGNIGKWTADLSATEYQPGSGVRDTERGGSEFSFPAPLWSDPCLEFAYKTLTGALPLDDNLAIEDYIQHQLRTSKQSNDIQSLPDIDVPSCFFQNPSPGGGRFPNSNGFGSHKTNK